jgi:hypothetical protein
MDLQEITNTFGKFIEAEDFMQNVADMASNPENAEDEF